MTDPAPTDAPPTPPPAAPPPPPSKGGGGLGSTLKVSALTTGSRVLGLVREQLFAALLGAGLYADAFVVAFRIPNLLRDLFAEGALSSAFVPTFARVEKERGAEAAHELANKVVGVLLIVVGALCLLGVLFAEQLAWALASGYAAEPGKLELAAYLARLMMPFLLLVSLAAVLMGMLNARRRFGPPALAPALFNVASIAVGVGLKLAGASLQTAVVGWALGTVLGGLAQFAIQLPAVRRDGFRLRPRLARPWVDPELRQIARLMAPATLGLAAVELNLFVNTQFASAEPGANTWLSLAFRLMYLPIGIFGVAVATVTATSLARRAAEKDLAGVAAGLGQGLRHVAFLTVPSTVGLIVLAEPIVSLLYEHGRFTAADSAQTAWALRGYAIGLFAYSGVKVAAPAFYALDRARVPLIGSAAAVATNLIVNLAAYRFLRPYGVGFVGIAVGTSLGAIVNRTILLAAFGKLTREVPRPPGQGAQLAKVALAAAAMGAAVWGALQGLDSLLPDRGTLAQLVRVLGCVALGGAVYAAACKLLRVGEMDEILGVVRRRARR